MHESEVLKLASNIEIVVKFWLFVFFLIFSWKTNQIEKKCKSFLLSFEALFIIS